MNRSYEDDILNLVKSYRKKETVDYCMSINSAKKLLVDKWRNGDMPSHAVGRILSNIIRMEKNYNPTPDCSYQNLLNLRFNDLLEGFTKACKMRRWDTLPAQAKAIEEYVLEQRSVNTIKDEDGNEISKTVYNLSEIFGIEDVVVYKYDKYLEEAQKQGYVYEFDERVVKYIDDSKKAIEANRSQEVQLELEEQEIADADCIANDEANERTFHTDEKIKFTYMGQEYEDDLESL